MVVHLTPPVVATTSVEIAPFNMTGSCGYTVTGDGASPITARGVCWSLNPRPTILDNKTVDGSGSGSFTSNLGTDFTNGYVYYFRAYATNSHGTFYGTEKIYPFIYFDPNQ
jgi:hypothetical protein